VIRSFSLCQFGFCYLLATLTAGHEYATAQASVNPCAARVTDMLGLVDCCALVHTGSARRVPYTMANQSCWALPRRPDAPIRMRGEPGSTWWRRLSGHREARPAHNRRRRTLPPPYINGASVARTRQFQTVLRMLPLYATSTVTVGITQAGARGEAWDEQASSKTHRPRRNEHKLPSKTESKSST